MSTEGLHGHASSLGGLLLYPHKDLLAEIVTETQTRKLEREFMSFTWQTIWKVPSFLFL